MTNQSKFKHTSTDKWAPMQSFHTKLSQNTIPLPILGRNWLLQRGKSENQSTALILPRKSPSVQFLYGKSITRHGAPFVHLHMKENKAQKERDEGGKSTHSSTEVHTDYQQFTTL